MKIIKQFLLLAVVLSVLFALPVSAAGKNLFVNLTSDDTSRWGMAIGMATMVLEKQKILGNTSKVKNMQKNQNILKTFS